jgi:hypothetical protein
MDLPERCRQADGNSQEAGQIERLPRVSFQNPIERLTARVFEYEDRPPFVTSEGQRLRCPSGIEFGCQHIFVFQSPETLRRLFCSERHHQDRGWVAVLQAAIKSEVSAFAERLQHVPGRLCTTRSHYEVSLAMIGGHQRELENLSRGPRILLGSISLELLRGYRV